MRPSRPVLLVLLLSLVGTGMLLVAAGPLAVLGAAGVPASPSAPTDITARAADGGRAGAGGLDAPSNTATPTPTVTPTSTPGLDIGSAQDVTCGGILSGDTRLGQSNVNSYSCLNYALPETGPEQIFRLTTVSTGTITASLRYDSRLYDVDIFILRGPSPDACVGGPPPGAIAYDTITVLRDALPGLYYLVVDTYDDGHGVRPGPYTLSVRCPAEPVQATATPTATPAVSPTPTRPPRDKAYVSIVRKDIPPTATPTFTPSPTPTPNPYSRGVNAGGSQAYTGTDGRRYEADRVYAPGAWGYDQGYDGAAVRPIGHNETVPDEVFQSFRGAFDTTKNLTYRFDVPSGVYRVTFLFAEVIDFAKPGRRKLNAYIEGQKVLENFDVAAEAQSLYGGSGLGDAVIVTSPDVRVTDGVLSIRFETAASSIVAAQINGLYVEKVGN